MTNEIGFSVEQPVSVWNRDIQLNPKTLFLGLGKMVASGATFDIKGVADNAIDLVKEAGLQNNAPQVGWLLIYQALHRSLVDLIKDYRDIFNQEISESKLETMAEAVSTQLNALPVVIDPSFFERPQDLPLLENLKPALLTWLQDLGADEIQATTIHARLKTSFVLSLHQEWLEKPTVYACIKEGIETPFTKANQVQQSWQRYYAWLQEQINQRMFDEVFGLKQVYVPLRAYYQDKENKCDREEIENHTEESQRIAVDLMEYLTDWVRNFNKDDCIRVVSGSPGSGKSSFSKMFAAHIAELKIMPVLFIPLHHFDPSDDLVTAVNQFVADDRYLTGTPLAGDGEQRLLLIFDGLDELSMQGKAAAEVALAFVDEVITKLDRFNGQGSQRMALLTGRDLAVQASSTKFRKTGQVLHVLPYFIEENARNNYEDPQQLLETDQRDDWWRNYGKAKGKNYAAMPDELKEENLLPITREPLLNYLVALSFERRVLDFSQSTTLNQVYCDLLDAVYNRQWDSHKHTGTGELTQAQFFRILEEIALAIWHGDGRTTTVAYIQKRCESSKLTSYLKCFQEGAEKGVTRLLTAFYFRQSDKLQEGDKTFEFTHKSFGEYLTARRIVEVVKRIDVMLKRHQENPDDGWDEREALHYWAEICGVTAIDGYLFEFIKNEIALHKLDELKDWQSNFIRLIASAVKHGMPMEKLALSSFQQMMIQSRNAEEALLAIHFSCAEKTEIVLPIDWGSPTACGEWLKRLQGQREGGANRLVLSCLAYLDLSMSRFDIFDFYDANLRGANLENSEFYLANFVSANLDGVNLSDAILYGGHKSTGGANLSEATLRYANLDGTDFEGVNFRQANLEGVSLKNSNLTRANLERANLINANLTKSNFMEANLERANLINATLTDSIFKNANLTEADLTGADLAGATFTDANLTETVGIDFETGDTAVI